MEKERVKNMLGKILSRDACAACRFCCSFRRCSLWETPLFFEEEKKRLEGRGYAFLQKQGYGLMDLMPLYKTDDPEEETACFFLDPEKGCVLEDDLKPFDCKIWPLRLMNRQGNIVLALTPTCPAVNRISFDALKEFVSEGLAQAIYEYGQKHPQMVKEYREGFPVLHEY